MIHWSRNLRDVEMLLPDGKSESILGEGVHWHHHAEMELTLFIEGNGTRFVGDDMRSFEPGDLVLLGKNLPHYWHTNGESSGLSVQWHFPEGHPVWGFPEAVAFSSAFRRAEKGCRITGDTATAATGLLHEMTKSTGAVRLGKLMVLLATLSEMPDEDWRPLSSKSFSFSGSQHQQAIATALKYIIAHFREEIRLEEVLEKVGMSRATFSRQFKEHSGRTFSEFINRLRIQASCRELVETDRSILEISLNCGFGQISFFNRLFKREKGCSPKSYRKARRI